MRASGSVYTQAGAQSSELLNVTGGGMSQPLRIPVGGGLHPVVNGGIGHFCPTTTGEVSLTWLLN